MNTVHPRLFGPQLTDPSINRPGLTVRYIQLLSLKSTRFTVGKIESHQNMLSRSPFFILDLNCFRAKVVLIPVSLFRFMDL